MNNAEIANIEKNAINAENSQRTPFKDILRDSSKAQPSRGDGRARSRACDRDPAHDWPPDALMP